MPRKRFNFLPLFLLLSAAGLRLWGLTAVPPGLTHDEADHGLSAWEIVQGARPLYLTVGNGREPLFDYATALVMGLTRPSIFVVRLTAVFFSLLILAAVYALVKKIGSPRLALLTLAGLAVGFWPLMAARQALRSITLPLFLVLAVYLWWGGRRPDDSFAPPDRFATGLAALFLGLSFYTYLASRVMWLLLPGMLLYWLIVNRERFQQMWRPTLAVLLLAGLLSAPLWLFLRQNPAAEQRIGQLTTTLQAAGQGDLSPLGTTIMDGVRLIPFKGDSAWRYNIADRPLLHPFLALLWGVGLVLGVARLFGRRPFSPTDGPIWRANLSREASALALGWLLLGLVPIFITGRFLANTQVIGILPVLYIFPAAALDWMLDRADSRSPFARAAVGFLFVVVALEGVQAYFFEWAEHPEVRLQYEAPLVELIEELNTSGRGVYAISNSTPGRYHSQPVGLLTLHNPAVSLQFFDGRGGVLIPAGEGIVALESENYHIASFLEGENPVEGLKRNNPDRRYAFYQVDGVAWAAKARERFDRPNKAVTFGDSIQLVGIDLPKEPLGPGEPFPVITWWTVERPADVDLVLFTQLVGSNGLPMSQVDRLDVPANEWAAGDHVVQRHMLSIPSNTPPGTYMLITGLYDPATGTRLLVNGTSQDHVELGRIETRDGG